MTTMPLCLGIGELMVELAPSDSPDSLRRGFAGDVFNTLYYARLLMPANWQVGFHTAFGTDSLSDDMIAFIDRHKSAIAEDIDGDPVFMAKSAWEVNYSQEKFPNITFHATKERS